MKAFLDGRMSKDKSTPLVAMKNSLLKWRVLSFFTNSHFFLYNTYSLQMYLQVIRSSFLRNKGI